MRYVIVLFICLLAACGKDVPIASSSPYSTEQAAEWVEKSRQVLLDCEYFQQNHPEAHEQLTNVTMPDVQWVEDKFFSREDEICAAAELSGDYAFFNADKDWFIMNVPFTSGRCDVRSIFPHEALHLAGLDHDNLENNQEFLRTLDACRVLSYGFGIESSLEWWL